MPYVLVRDTYNVTIVDLKRMKAFILIKNKHCEWALNKMFNEWDPELRSLTITIIEYSASGEINLINNKLTATDNKL
jgi:hypothetical protein